MAVQTPISPLKTRDQSAVPAHAFRTYDPRLEPIAAKVMAQQRLSANDGLALYASS